MLSREYATGPEEPGTSHIRLGKGRWAVIDASDYDLVKDHMWILGENGNVLTRRRDQEMGQEVRRTFYLHHKILGTNEIVRHINRDNLDCRRSNLEIVDAVEHQERSGKMNRDTSSIYKGVYYWIARGMWRADCRVNKAKYYLGCFATEEAAARAYDAFVMKNKPNAYTNFPEQTK